MTRSSARARRGSASVAALVGFVLSLAVVAASTYLGASAERRHVTQPIAFNHRVHVEDQELECSMCHPFYESEASSGMPGAATCAMCHLEPQGESVAERALVARLQAGEPLEWGRLFRQPPHVFYSHRRHVVVAGLQCEVCHGQIGLSERPPSQATPMSMEACLDCHVREQASADCTACHR
jgi:hypothetical protein